MDSWLRRSPPYSLAPDGRQAWSSGRLDRPNPKIVHCDGSYSGRGTPTAAMMSRLRLVISRR
jgi:hypothetical protein